METVQQKARKLHSYLLRSGFRSYYDDSRAFLTPKVDSVEVTLGIPNVLPHGAQGDVLIQFSEPGFGISADVSAGKISSDLIRFPESKGVEIAMACNTLNTQLCLTRFYASPNELVVVADRDFFAFDDSCYERIAKYLSVFKNDVNNAIPILKYALTL